MTGRAGLAQPHAFGMSVVPERFVFRMSGMVLTLTMLGLAAAVCLVGALRGP